MNGAIKAYWTTDSQGENQQIIFAESRAQAIYKSEAYQWGEDYIGVRVKRMKDLDQFASLGYVPKSALLEKGWWFECCGYKCSKHVTEDDSPVIVDEYVFCSNECSESRMVKG